MGLSISDSYGWHVDAFIMLNLIVIHVNLDIDVTVQILQTWFMQPINLTALLNFFVFSYIQPTGIRDLIGMSF